MAGGKHGSPGVSRFGASTISGTCILRTHWIRAGLYSGELAALPLRMPGILRMDLLVQRGARKLSSGIRNAGCKR